MPSYHDSCYDDKIDDLISRIKDPDIRAIINIPAKSKVRIKDCVNNGGIERLARYIIHLEENQK